VALKADSMDIKARLASDQYNILSLRNSLESQKEQLNELLGRDLQTPFSVSSVSEIPSVEVTLRQARERALASRSELRQGRLGIQQAELNWQIKKSEYIPDVSFVATDMSTVNVNLLPSNIASVGVLLTWTPLDWGRRKHELAEDAKAIAQSKNSLSEAQDQILVDVGDKFRKLEQSQALIAAALLSLEAGKERLRVMMNQFEQKAVLFKDVAQQKAAVQNSVDQYQQALLVFWTAKADFEAALGED